MRDGEIDVRTVPLEGDGPSSAALLPWLSADERERADRFRHEHVRRRFVRARAAVRSLLTEYVGAAPSALRTLPLAA
jgi:4'-phosphopantetheinyl transferase